MSGRQTATFHEALDIVESLPEYQQESLIDIVRHRLIEYRRSSLASSIKEAKREYKNGKVRRGSIDEIMKEIA